MDKQQLLDAIATLNGVMSTLYSVGKKKESGVVAEKILELIKQL